MHGDTTERIHEEHAPDPAPDQLDGMPASPVDQLPLFDGWRVWELELALAGSIALQLTQEANRELYNAAELRQHATVTVTVGEHDPITLDARVTQKTVKVKSSADGKRTVQVVRVTVLDDEG